MKNYDVVIIGGGIAGLSASVELFDLGITNILLLERDQELGGILNQCIHDGFGLEYFKEELTGPTYAHRFIQMLNERNIDYRLNTAVLHVTEDKVITYTNEIEGVVVIQSKVVLLTVGCKERTRGAIAIPGVRSVGVMTAGVAQHFLNIEGYQIGKRVFILGSGDIGLIMARRMTLEGAKVLGVAEIMPYSNGLNRNIVQCLDDYNIPLYLSHTVTNIIGKTRVEQIELSEVDEHLQVIPNTTKYFDVDTLLLSVGLIPDVSLVESLPIEIDPKTKSIAVFENLESSIPGIFASGNGLHVHDLVDYVTKESQRVAKYISVYLKNKVKEPIEYIRLIPGNGVSYTIPQKIRISLINENLIVYFRVTKANKQATFYLMENDQVILKVKKTYVAPSEMQHLTIPLERLLDCNDNLTLMMEEG